MAQVNGSHFKLVYSHWFHQDSKSYPLSNGLHPAVISWIQEYINRESPNVDENKFRLELIDTMYSNIDHGIVYRHSELMNNFLDAHSITNFVREDQVIDDGSVYLFPVELESDRFRFLKDDISFTVNNVVYDYYFKDTLSPTMLTLIQTGKVKLIFSNMVDPSLDDGTLEIIESKLKDAGIPGSNIVFLQGNINGAYKGDMKMLSSDISLNQTSNSMPDYPQTTSLGYISDYVRFEDLNSNTIRTKKFLCFNRNMHRIHRLGLAHLALKYDLLKDGYFSFLAHVHPNIHSQLLHVTVEDNDELAIISKKVRDLIPYELDTQHVQDKMSFTTNENNKKDLYLDSYLHITSETEFDSISTPFFSEKTWRPILNLQPFIYVGNYKSLEKLRTMGFKTFSPFIDESYDLIEDRRERFFAIEKEIKKFSLMSKEELHNWYYSITDILLHNQTLLSSFADYDPIQEIYTI